MNYWLLTTEYPPFHGGGISTYCYFTARMLSAAGHSVTVFIPDDGIAGQQSTDPAPGITLIRFSSNRNKLQATLGYTARLSYSFADIVRTTIEEKGQPDLIEAQDYLGIAYYLTQFKHAGYAFMDGIPILVTLHSPAFIYLDYNRVPVFRFPDFWTGEMEKQAIRAADMLISPTRFLVDEIQKYMDIGDRPVQIVPNPYEEPAAKASVSAGALSTGSSPLSLTDRPYSAFQRNRIVYYGKLSPQKGSFEMLSFFKDLWDEGFLHALHIIGGTDIVFHPEKQTMGQWVEQRYRKYIDGGLLRLHGKIRPEEIVRSLSDAHVILVPSIVDNLPYTVIEAMSLGKVVLASRQGGQREMIEDGRDGFLFDHGSPESFARQLRIILDLGDGQLERIGLNARDSVRRNYDPARILPIKMATLEPLLPASGTARLSVRQGGHHFPFLHQEKFDVLPLVTGQLLTVVIPYFNMGPWIEECVQSILDSSYPFIEILVVDDGSTETASLEKLERLASRFKEPQSFHPGSQSFRHLTVLRQTNAGLALTRNQGALAAKGDFLAFLDADDKVAPAYYEKTILALRHNDNAFFAGSWVQYFGDGHALWAAFTPQPPYALVHNPVNSSGLVYKRVAFLAAGMNDKKTDYGLEDFGSLVSMLSHGLNGIILPEPLFYYRVRKGSMFRQVNREKFIYSYKYILEQHKPYYTKFAGQIINLLNANGPGFQFDNPSFGVQVSTIVEKDGRLIRRLKSIVKKNKNLKRIAIILNNKLKLIRE